MYANMDIMSQSLRKSGQFLLTMYIRKTYDEYESRNPFVNQVSFFIEAWAKSDRGQAVAIPS